MPIQWAGCERSTSKLTFIQSCPNCSAYGSHLKSIDFFGMKLFWIHKNVPLGIGNTYIWGFFHFIHPQGLIDKISSIKFVFGLMSKQNQLNQTKCDFHTQVPTKGSCLLHFGKFQNSVFNHLFDVPIATKNCQILIFNHPEFILDHQEHIPSTNHW